MTPAVTALTTLTELTQPVSVASLRAVKGGCVAGIAQYIDHTCLRADAVGRDIAALCQEARDFGCAAVCVNPRWVEQVDGWFGRPVSLEQRSSGFTVYRYFHEETTTRDTGFFTRIGAFIARIFGYGVYRSPVNVRYQNRVRHELIIAFDPDGVVASNGYERTEMPSKKVY